MSNGTASPCPCAQCQEPQVVSNPPGLSQIAYRVDDFTGFRQAMLRPRPASRPSAPGGPRRAISACRSSSGGPTWATC